MKFLHYILFAVLSLSGCSKPDESVAVKATVEKFVGIAFHEFYKLLGSTPNNRWELPFVTRELFVLVDMEYAQGRAFNDGLGSEGRVVPEYNFVRPRSHWVPIVAEGSYTYTLQSPVVTGTNATVPVRFHNKIGSEIMPDQKVTYHLVKQTDGWKISEITREDGFSLIRYLSRKDWGSLDEMF